VFIRIILHEVTYLSTSTEGVFHDTASATFYRGAKAPRTVPAGPRAGECSGLRPEDIDSKRMLIHIRNAKGNKDRSAVIGNCAIELLREYFKAYRPKTWLFEGNPKEKQLHIRSIQKVFKRAIREAGIKKAVRPHTLRHSFAGLRGGAP
jgi:site-specific recombinase XerD